jgi:hypothetical protein
MHWCLIYSYMFRHFRMPSSGSQIWTWWDCVQCRGKQRKMGAVYCDRRRSVRDTTNSSTPNITPSVLRNNSNYLLINMASYTTRFKYSREVLFMPGVETRALKSVAVCLTDPFRLTPRFVLTLKTINLPCKRHRFQEVWHKDMQYKD